MWEIGSWGSGNFGGCELSLFNMSWAADTVADLNI